MTQDKQFKLVMFSTPENKHFAFNIPNEAQQSPVGFYAITDKVKELNKHIDFDYLAHDLEHRGLSTSNNLVFTVKHLHNPLKAKSDDFHETRDKWLFTCEGQSFEFYTGIGHRIPAMGFRAKQAFNDYRGKNLTQYGFDRFINEFSRPKYPTPTDLLYCLVMDASASEESFEDWCSNFGYDSDSIKALETYRECQKTASKLRKLKLNLENLREALECY